jgi:hypothetical protein
MKTFFCPKWLKIFEMVRISNKQRLLLESNFHEALCLPSLDPTKQGESRDEGGAKSVHWPAERRDVDSRAALCG